MPEVILSPAARNDIAAILAWTIEHFGEAAEHRYHRLLTQAVFDIGEDPERVGSIRRDEISESSRNYHLAHSRRNIPGRDRVSKPRHFLLFRHIKKNLVEVGRVLRDSVDLPQHLSEEFRAPG
jgi:toxin ParE1/3/4